MLLFLCVLLALTGLAESAVAVPKVWTSIKDSLNVFSIFTASVQNNSMNLPVTSIATSFFIASKSVAFNISEQACEVNAACTLTPTAGTAFLGFDVCFGVGRLIA